MALVFGQVPHPPVVKRIITTSSCCEDSGPRTPVGTCVHRMDGTLLGTDDYFRNEGSHCQETNVGGLTDFGIGGKLEIDAGRPDLDGVI